MKKEIVRIILLAAMFPALCMSQKKQKPDVKRYFMHSHGLAFQQFDDLSERVNANPQYTPLKNTTGTLQFGLMTERSKVVLHFSGASGSSFSGSKTRKSTAIRSLSGAVDIGYIILDHKRVTVYPFAGIGYTLFTVVLRKDISSVPFDSVLRSPAVQQSIAPVKLTNSFINWRLGAAINIASVRHPRNSFGIQAGYTGGFNKQEWKINDMQSLLSSPKDGLSQFFVQLLIRYRLQKRG